MSQQHSKAAADLKQLLHPYDERDVPVPGFPLGDALVAWIRDKPIDEIWTVLTETLLTDPIPQQVLAMALLRAKQASVRGVWRDDTFEWEVALAEGKPTVIRPVHQPTREAPTNLSFQDSSRSKSLGEVLEQSVKAIYELSFASLLSSTRSIEDPKLV